MQFNYHYLVHLVPALSKVLGGAAWQTAFSQNKDELVLGFSLANGDDFWMRLSFGSPLLIDFPNSFSRARANSITLLTEAHGKEVNGFTLYENERAFDIELSDGFVLQIQLFGKRGNVLLLQNGEAVNQFRHHLSPIPAQHRPINQTETAWLEATNPLKELFPTLGPLPLAWLETQGFSQLPPAGQWELVQELQSHLRSGNYYAAEREDGLHFSLVPFEGAVLLSNQPIEVANAFARALFTTFGLGYQRASLVKQLEKQNAQSRAYIAKTWQRLEDLENELQPQQAGDILMANLHAIKTAAEEVSLFNFYNDKEVIIKLNKDLSPAKNAENYYRKARNRRIELEKLSDNLAKREEEVAKNEEHIAALMALESLREFKEYIKLHQLIKQTEANAVTLPYNSYELQGWQILVGKHSSANDTLTFKVASQNDYWLHARDVAGSHVIIRNQAGKTLPKPVLEYAAALAAGHSKRKNDSLCPVMYTQRKWVRKIKGAAPGLVRVDKEQVLMVQPVRA